MTPYKPTPEELAHWAELDKEEKRRDERQLKRIGYIQDATIILSLLAIIASFFR